MDEGAEELAAAVAQRCLDVLGSPGGYGAPDGYEHSLALCTVDAIWSMGVRYSTVDNVIVNYRGWLADTRRGSARRRSASELVADIDAAGGPARFADEVVKNRNRTSSRNGVLKAQAVYQAACALNSCGVTTAEDLRSVAHDSKVKQAWRDVPGQRSGISWHYLLILAHVEDVKADRMICRFVTAATGGLEADSATARLAVIGAHRLLVVEHPGLSLRTLDHEIWRYQRSKSK